MNVPKLRFKGCTNNWKHKLMSEVVAINPKVGSLPERFIYIDLDSVNSGVLVTKKIIEKKNAPSRAQRLLSDQDILIQTVRPYQKNHLLFKTLEMESVASTGYAQLKTKVEIDPEFIYQLFYTGRINEEINKRCTGTSYPAISAKDLETLYISIPSYDEQVRISVFLKTIDKKIQLQQEKIDLLKAQKQGFLKKMFPKANTTHPTMRFNGYTDDWKQLKFGEIIEERREKTKIEDEDILLSSAISGMYLNSELFTHFRGTSNIGYLKIKKNDLILSAQNLHLGNCNVNRRFEHGIISPAYKVYSLVNVNPDFIHAWLKKDSTKQFFERATTEGASVCRKNIDWNTLYNQKIYIPNQDEQRKIGEFFNKIDDAIINQQKKLELLQIQKQAFMQQMFI